MALTELFAVVNVAFLVAVTGAGAFVFRRQYSRGLTEIQERVITALREENASLTSRLGNLQREVADLNSTLATLRIALKRRGLLVKINGDYVSITDVGISHETTVKIRKETAVHMATEEDTTRTANQDSDPSDSQP